MAWVEAYLDPKFHFDPSNRLVTIHQRHRQTDRTGQTGQENGPIAQGEPFYKRSPKKAALTQKLSYVFAPIGVDFGTKPQGMQSGIFLCLPQARINWRVVAGRA